MKKRFFITGTDTDVGKTYVSCALLKALNQQGYSTMALKPLACGGAVGPEGLRNADVLALQAAMSLPLSGEQINPILFEPPIAPHLAALQVQKTLSAQEVWEACKETLTIAADYTLIEGCGGWLVPLNGRETLADFVPYLECEVILVVGMRIGCLNHALLSVHNIQERGLKLAGWVANCVDPHMLSREDNIKSLQERIEAPLLAIVPYQGDWPLEFSKFL